MVEDYESQRRKQITLRRAIMDFSMGIIFFLLGLFLLLYRSLGIQFGNNRSAAIDLIFGTMCVLYGAWRIYRGYKKDYFKD